jgi:hypothetical protein
MKTPAKFLAPTLAAAINLINCTPATEQTTAESPATVPVQETGSTNPQALPQDEEERRFRKRHLEMAEDMIRKTVKTLENIEEATRTMVHTVLANDPAGFVAALAKCSESPKQEICHIELAVLQSQGCTKQYPHKRDCDLEIQLKQLECKNEFTKCFGEESRWIILQKSHSRSNP